jgi:mannose-6-phosphate isomerase-like protein (cupin superfamily)
MAVESTTESPKPQAAERGASFTAVHLGALESLERFEIRHPKLKRPAKGKVFLKESLGLTGLEVSLNRFPKGVTMPFAHKHEKNEELYLFVRGRGEMLVDGQVIPVSEGSLVRIAPEGARTLRSFPGEDLYFVCIQARAGSLPEGTGSDGRPADAMAWPS